MSFDGTYRVLLENSPQPLHAQVLGEIAKVEAEIGTTDRGELDAQVDRIHGAVTIAHINQAAAIREELGEIKAKFEKKREQRSTVELMKQGDARSRIEALDDAGLGELAMAYVNESEDLNVHELRELQIRVRQIDDLAHLTPTLKTEIQERRADRPELDQEGRELADLAEDLTNLRAGHVRLEYDGDRFDVDVHDLVDWAGELAEEPAPA
jgi:hypothetical protein